MFKIKTNTPYTKGNIAFHINNCSLVTLFVLLFQQIPNFIELYYINKTIPSNIAVLGIVSIIHFLILALGFFISSSGTTLIARAWGAKRVNTSIKLYKHIFSIGIIISVAIIILSYTIGPYYLKKISANNEVYENSLVYLFVCIPGYLFQFISFIIFSSIRAVGKIFITSFIQFVNVILSIVITIIFLDDKILGLGIVGAGWAISLTGLLSLFVIMLYFCVCFPFSKRVGFTFRVKFSIIKKIFLIGSPSSLDIIINILIISITFFFLKNFGVNEQSAFSLVLKPDFR